MQETIPNDFPEILVISSPFRGDIRCRVLKVSPEGSVLGDVRAEVVENRGVIKGSVRASSKFVQHECGVLAGSAFSPQIVLHPKSVVETPGLSNAGFPTTEPTPLTSTAAIRAAVAEGFRGGLRARGERESAARPAPGRDDDVVTSNLAAGLPTTSSGAGREYPGSRRSLPPLFAPK